VTILWLAPDWPQGATTSAMRKQVVVIHPPTPAFFSWGHWPSSPRPWVGRVPVS